MAEPLNEEENKQLEVLNYTVEEAIKKRKEWLDKKMTDKSNLKVGDKIYCLKSLTCLGVVSELYRYHQDDPRFDSYSCDYRYETTKNCFDNTSRQFGLRYGTYDDAVKASKKERVIKYAEKQLEIAKGK